MLINGCRPGEPPEPTLCEVLFGETQQIRQDVSMAEAFALCSDVAVGTVTGVKTLEEDYLPIMVSDERPEHLFYAAVPLEQWSVDHAVVTVSIDRVLSGDKFDAEATATFNIPILFRELTHWDDENPVYSGRTFTLGEPDDALPSVEDKVVLLQSDSKGSNRLVGSNLSFVFCGDNRLNIGWLRAGVYSSEYYKDSETDPRYRRNVIMPRKPDESVLEAAFIAPMRARQKLSQEEAEAESDFIVSGTVSSVSYESEWTDTIYPTVLMFEYPLESWSFDCWQVTVTIDEVKKANGTDLGQEARIVLFLPTQLRRIDEDETLPVSSFVPETGSTVLLYWNEGFRDASVDWLMRSEGGVCDILYAFVSRTDRPDL